MKHTIIAAPIILQNSFIVKIMGLDVEYFVNKSNDGRVKGLFKFNGNIIHSTNVSGDEIEKDLDRVENKIKKKIYSAEICQYCGKETRFDILHREYHCDPCGASIGCHKVSMYKALGSVADYDLRFIRKNVHQYFDKLWTYATVRGINEKPIRMSSVEYLRNWQSKCRNAAYKWLADKMQMDKTYCHIGMFDYAQCEDALGICIGYCEQPDLYYDEVRGMVRNKSIIFKKNEYK